MIEKNINETLVKGEPSAKALINSLFLIDKELDFDQASVYHQFPIYPNSDNDTTISANVIFITKKYGLFIFQCIDADSDFDIKVYSQALSEIDRLIFSKVLKESPKLQKNRRSLKFDIIPVIYFHKEVKIESSELDFEVVFTEKQLSNIIIQSEGEELSDEEFKDLKATIEGSKGIVRSNSRDIKDTKDFENSKGAILRTN